MSQTAHHLYKECASVTYNSFCDSFGFDKSAIERILDFYPYDGSGAEINEFYNKSLDIEKYIRSKIDGGSFSSIRWEVTCLFHPAHARNNPADIHALDGYTHAWVFYRCFSGWAVSSCSTNSRSASGTANIIYKYLCPHDVSIAWKG